MRPARAKITIDRPIEEVYDYLLDIGSRPEFAPTIFRDFRLTRVESTRRRGGRPLPPAPQAARPLRGHDDHRGRPRRAHPRRGLDRPRRPRAAGDRVPARGAARRRHEVEWTIETHPLNLADQIREFRFRRQIKRRMPRSLRRLRGILEKTPNVPQGDRATVAGLDSNYVPNP